MAAARSTGSRELGRRTWGARLLAGTVIVGATVLGMAGTAEAIVYYRTAVTINARGTDLSGSVYTRSKTRCAKNRNITVYKQKGTRQNPASDTRIGSDTASLSGTRYAWSTGNTGQTGKLYARAARKLGCLADTSRTVVVAPQP